MSRNKEEPIKTDRDIYITNGKRLKTDHDVYPLTKKEERETVKVEPQWMVLTRHFAMPGGLLDYGEASIEEFFDSFEEADAYAKKLFEDTNERLVMPFIWVLRCERTYRSEGIADSREK